MEKLVDCVHNLLHIVERKENIMLRNRKNRTFNRKIVEILTE